MANTLGDMVQTIYLEGAKRIHWLRSKSCLKLVRYDTVLPTRIGPNRRACNGAGLTE